MSVAIFYKPISKGAISMGPKTLFYKSSCHRDMTLLHICRQSMRTLLLMNLKSLLWLLAEDAWPNVGQWKNAS